MSDPTTPTTPTPNRILSLAAAGKLAPFGGVSPVSVWRWHKKGVLTPDGQRVRLQVVKIGRKLGTTEQFLNEFFLRAGSCSESAS